MISMNLSFLCHIKKRMRDRLSLLVWSVDLWKLPTLPSTLLFTLWTGFSGRGNLACRLWDQFWSAARPRCSSVRAWSLERLCRHLLCWFPKYPSLRSICWRVITCTSEHLAKLLIPDLCKVALWNRMIRLAASLKRSDWSSPRDPIPPLDSSLCLASWDSSISNAFQQVLRLGRRRPWTLRRGRWHHSTRWMIQARTPNTPRICRSAVCEWWVRLAPRTDRHFRPCSGGCAQAWCMTNEISLTGLLSRQLLWASWESSKGEIPGR